MNLNGIFKGFEYIAKGMSGLTFPQRKISMHYSGFEQDAIEIENDWRIVGNDLGNAMKSFEEEVLTEEQRSKLKNG